MSKTLHYTPNGAIPASLLSFIRNTDPAIDIFTMHITLGGEDVWSGRRFLDRIHYSIHIAHRFWETG